MTQKRTCEGCRAARLVPQGILGDYYAPACDLGYEVKWGKKILGVNVEQVPLEPCPKPKTWREFDYAQPKQKEASNA